MKTRRPGMIGIAVLLAGLQADGFAYCARAAESSAAVVYMSNARNLRWMTAKTREPELRWVNPDGTDRTVLRIDGQRTATIELTSGEESYHWRIAEPSAETVEEDVYTLSLMHYAGDVVLSSNKCDVVVVNGAFTPVAINFSAETGNQSRGWTHVRAKRVPLPCDSQWAAAGDANATGTLVMEHGVASRNIDVVSSGWHLLDVREMGGSGSYELNLDYPSMSASWDAYLTMVGMGLILSFR